MVGLLALLVAQPIFALNKQGARQEIEKQTRQFNLSGFVFAGGFLFNPTYAARPNNTGLAALRFGLHVDIDALGPWLTVSYDGNFFTDGSNNSPGWYLASEQDHIVGLLTSIPLPKNLSLSFAIHYEIDAPVNHPNAAFRATHPDCGTGTLTVPNCYDPNFTQSYVDVYSRLTWSKKPFLLAAALGGFVYNPTYAARPDNAGLALLRYVLHGEFEALPWLIFRLDLNFFTDRDEHYVVPTELDATTEVAFRWRSLELRILGEADLPIGSYPIDGPNPSPLRGLKQFYLASLLQWNFDLLDTIGRFRGKK